jgi:hypothetical protein
MERDVGGLDCDIADVVSAFDESMVVIAGSNCESDGSEDDVGELERASRGLDDDSDELESGFGAAEDALVAAYLMSGGPKKTSRVE